MENEAPNYASWIPAAGGYVANGNVVSKSPIYENGKLKTEVDTSVFNTTQPTTTKAQPQSANNPLTNSGITTANTAGSNEDVNSVMTGAGSLASLDVNTGITGSALDTPAVKSIVAKYTPDDLLSQANQKYLDAVARNDYKAMIEALTEASRIDGVDRTEQINNLWKARGEKIRAKDDSYLNLRQQIKQAMNAVNADTSLTDEQKAAKLQELQAQDEQLANEQQAYRDMVGYDDQMSMDKNVMQETLDLEFKSTWSQAFNDITNALMQALPTLLNFQYNPYQDTSLQIAQGYATSKVKEQMNSTGMYYSSMTQNAISKAVAELVPVYEKMAKDEALQNFNLLQQTASYLMDLEKHQFDMWKTQIQLKWEEAEQKQKQVDNAINNANARGYYTNEEAILVGVPAGTESYEARKEAEEVQRTIAAEQRKLIQDKALERFSTDMNIEYLKEQYNQMKEYYDYQRLHPQTASSGGSGGNSGNKVTIKTEGANGEEITLTMDYDEAVSKGYIKESASGDRQYVDQDGNVITVSGSDFADKYTTNGTIDKKKAWSFINNDLKDLNNAERSKALSEILNNVVIQTIRKNSDKYSDNRDETMAAFNDSFTAIQDFARSVANSGIGDDKAEMILVGYDEDGNKVPGLLHQAMNELLQSIEGAGSFDNVFGDWGAIHGDATQQLVDSKANAKKDIYNLMNNSDVPLIKNKLKADYSYLQSAQGSTQQKQSKQERELAEENGKVYVAPGDVKWGTGTGYYITAPTTAEEQEAINKGAKRPKIISVTKGADGRYYYKK